MLRRMDRDAQFGRDINPLLVCIKMGISSGVVKYYFIFSELAPPLDTYQTSFF